MAFLRTTEGRCETSYRDFKDFDQAENLEHLEDTLPEP